jgi:hypothetical protein
MEQAPEQEQEQEMEREHKWVEEDSCSYQVHIEDNFDEKPMMMKMVMTTLLWNSLLPSNFIQINKKTQTLRLQDQYTFCMCERSRRRRKESNKTEVVLRR